MGPLGLRAGWRGIVSTASTSVSKTESPGSNPGAPAICHNGTLVGAKWPKLLSGLIKESLRG